MTSLIEKSTDIKLLRTVTKIVDDWVRNRVSSFLGYSKRSWLFSQHDLPSHAGPTLREKSLLLSRMMTFYEKRFSDDPELLPMFLDTVLYAFKSALYDVCCSCEVYSYRDDHLSQTELTAKLEPAFLCGLRYSQVQIRMKFFEVKPVYCSLILTVAVDI